MTDPKTGPRVLHLQPERQRPVPGAHAPAGQSPAVQAGLKILRPQKVRPYGTPKAAVQKLFDQAGGNKRVMVKLDRSKTQVAAYTDPREREELNIAQAAALTQPGCDALAQYLAHLAGGVFLPLPQGEGVLPELSAGYMREVGETMARIVEMLADGKVTETELRETIREMDEDFALLAAMRSAAQGMLDRLVAPGGDTDAVDADDGGA